VQLAVRASAVPLILLLVKAPGDGPLVVAASALTGLLGGAAALIWMRGNLALDWRWPRRRAMRAEFLESGAIFLSRVWIVLYTSLTPTILGAVAGAAVVGQYVLADKVCGAAQSLVAPLAQALFPRMSYLFAHDQPAAQRLLWRSAKLIALVSGAMSVALFLLAEPLVLFAAGRAFLSSVPVLRWLAPLPLVVAMSNVLGVQIMLARGMFRSVNRILRSAGIISLVTVAPLSLWMGAAGAALNTCVITCLVTVGFAVTVFRTKAWC
jgi:O-antigen/teichoic acid export membrane protein